MAVDAFKESYHFRGIHPEMMMWSEACDVRIEKQKLDRRQVSEGTTPHLPYAEMTDEQLSDVYHYFYFPRTAQNIFAEGVSTFRCHPYETDPNKCYYDLIMMGHFPQHQQPVPTEHIYFDHRVQFGELLDPSLEVASFILQQDPDSELEVQQGVRSEGYKGMNLREQEIRVRYFHNRVDLYLDGSEPE